MVVFGSVADDLCGEMSDIDILVIPLENTQYWDFRHKFRHLYSFELDWERECLVAKKFPETVKKFRTQVDDFIQKLEQQDKSERS